MRHLVLFFSVMKLRFSKWKSETYTLLLSDEKVYDAVFKMWEFGIRFVLSFWHYDLG